MDDFENYIRSIAYNSFGHVQADLDFSVHDAYCNDITEPITFNIADCRFGFHSMESVPVQSRQPRKIDRAQWEKAKDAIHHQYIIRNCTLNELALYMEKQHAFVASKQQYVRKLKEWKFEKNRQSQDWSAISHALKRRRLEVDKADVYLNGTLIPSKKLKKEISRWDRPSLQTKYIDHSDPRAEAPLRMPDGFIITRHDTYSIPVSPPRHLPWFDFVDYLTTLSSNLRPEIYESARQQLLTPEASNDRCNLLVSIFQADQTTSGVCQREKPNQLAAHLARRLSPMLVERTPGDLEQALTEMSTTQSPFKIYAIVSAYAIYLCANHLAGESTLPAFVSMLKNHELGKAFLGQLLDTKNLTSQVFMTTLFHHSVVEADFWLLEQIIPKITNIDIKLKSHHAWTKPQSALHMAIAAGDLDVARFLLSSGSNPNQCLLDEYIDCCQEQKCLRPMDLAARRGGSIELIHDLLDVGANFNKKRILPSAIRSGADTELIGRLIMAGALIQASIELDYVEEADGLEYVYEHPLRDTILHGRTDIFEQLIHNYRLPPNAQDAFDWKTAEVPHRVGLDDEPPGLISPLICAIICGDGDTINSLIAMGADVNECICQCLSRDWHWSVEAISGEKFVGPSMGCKFDLLVRLGRDVSSPLQAAAFAEDEDLVQKLINLGACVESCHGTSALVHSVFTGNYSLTELLLESGADPNAFEIGIHSLTPLMVAVAKDDAAMVVLLLSYGADIDLETAPALYPQNALVRLYVSQCDEQVRRLARINTRNNTATNHDTCLKISNSLIPSSAGPSSDALADSSASCWSVPPELFEEVLEDPHGINPLKVCLEGGSDPCQLIGSGRWSPLVLTLYNICYDCDNGDDELLKRVSLLLRYGSKIDLPEFSKILATERDRWRGIMEQVLLFPECLTDLLQIYTDEIREAVRLSDAERLHQIVPAVLIAMKKQNPAFEVSQTLCHVLYASSFAGSMIEEVARVLFEKGSHINSTINVTDISPWLIMNDCKFTLSANVAPLHLLLGWTGSNKGHTDICHTRLGVLKFLVDAGADVNRVCTVTAAKVEFTPLQQACGSRGCLDEVRCLVEAGADVNAPVCSTYWYGQTALQAAADRGNLEMVEYLLVRGASVNAPAGANGGATALQYAAGRGYFRIVQTLVESGANVDAPGAEIDGRTAIEVAAENGRIDCLYYLLDNYKGQVLISEVCERAARYARKEGHHVIAEFLCKFASERATMEHHEM